MARVLKIAIAAFLVLFVAVQLWPQTPDIQGSDKHWHAALYFGFAVVVWPILGHRGLVQRIALLLAAGLLAAVVLEFLQGSVGRNPELGDVVADAAGLVAACVALTIGARFHPGSRAAVADMRPSDEQASDSAELDIKDVEDTR